MVVDPESGHVIARVDECPPSEDCQCYQTYSRIKVDDLEDGQEYDVLLVGAWIGVADEYVPPDDYAVQMAAEGQEAFTFGASAGRALTQTFDALNDREEALDE
jgi:hypothetical protein